MRKKLNALNGIKCKTVFSNKKNTPHYSKKGILSQAEIDKCLNCTKPASECKGDCNVNSD